MSTSDFSLALRMDDPLEAERNLYIATERGVRLPAKGQFKLDPVESLPSGTGKAPFWLFTREEMATVDV